MFGSEVLDVAIGLVLVYLLLSLFATALREAAESIVKARAVLLEQGIRELLDDVKGTGLAKEFYEHPLIYSLYKGPYVDPNKKETEQEDGRTKGRYRGGNLPTYIPSTSFSTALVDLVVRGPADKPNAEAQPAAPTLQSLCEAVGRIESARVKRALLIAIDNAEGDLAKARQNIEQWFDRSMERVSSWYKRRTQFWLLLIGGVSTLALNVNTITIAQHLARSKAARELVVGFAERTVGDTALGSQMKAAAGAASPAGTTGSAGSAGAAGDTTTTVDSGAAGGATADSNATAADSSPATRASRQAAAAISTLQIRKAQLDSLSLPLGWERAPNRPTGLGKLAWLSWWMQQIVGLMLTILAITLGAPFWFDALSKIMNVRSAVKPKEKEAA